MPNIELKEEVRGYLQAELLILNNPFDVHERITAWGRLCEELIVLGKIEMFHIKQNGLDLDFDSSGVRFHIKFDDVIIQQNLLERKAASRE